MTQGKPNVKNMNMKTSHESSNTHRHGALSAGLLGLLVLASIGCGPEGSPSPEGNGSGAMVHYRGAQVSLEWLLQTQPELSCDDHLGSGILSCYDSPAEREANRQSGQVSAQSCGFPGTHYATVWEHYGYSGFSLELYNDYENLGALTNSWNDRISSVQVRPGCMVSFFQDINYGPGVLGKITYSEDKWYVDSTYNDQFSSVRRGQ